VGRSSRGRQCPGRGLDSDELRRRDRSSPSSGCSRPSSSDPTATYRRCGEGHCVEVHGLRQGRLLRWSFAVEGGGGCCAGSSSVDGADLPSTSAGRDRESERDRASREGSEIEIRLFFILPLLFSTVSYFNLHNLDSLTF
jgi:hypothetical protein